MAKLDPYIVNNFNEGMTSNLRGNYGFSLISHFDVFPDRLVQERSFKEDSLDDNDLINVILASNGNIYALATDEGATGVNGIWLKGNGADPQDDGWATSYASGQIPLEDFLFDYKGFLFFMDEGNDLCHFELSGATMTNDFQTNLTPCTLGEFVNQRINKYARPLHHKKDDYAYFFDAQNVYRLTDAPGTGTWSTVYTIASDYEISARCEYSSAMMLGITSLSDSNESRVLIIDQNLDSNFIIDSLSVGKGTIKAMSMCDGVPTVIIDRRDINRSSMHIYQYDGIKFREINSIYDFQMANSTFFHEDGEKLYFGGEIDTDDTYSTQTFGTFDEEYTVGVYSVDREGQIRCEVTTYQTGNKIESANNMGAITGFLGYWFVCGNNNTLYKSTDGNYNQTSVLQTRILDFGQPLTKKQLTGVIVSHEPSESDDSVTIQYKKVGDNVWNTMLTSNLEEDKKTSAVLKNDGSEVEPSEEYIIRILVSELRTLTGLAVFAESYPDDKFTP